MCVPRIPLTDQNEDGAAFSKLYVIVIQGALLYGLKGKPQKWSRQPGFTDITIFYYKLYICHDHKCLDKEAPGCLFFSTGRFYCIT